jgi:hypothetical protein
LVVIWGNVLAADGVTLLSVENQARVEAAPALVAGQPARLHFLLPPQTSLADAVPHLFQLAGSLARPLPAEVVVQPDPSDSRLVVISLTPPSVTRVTQFVLQVGKLGSQTLVVFPAATRRDDIAPLAEVLETSRLRLMVCGASPELRAYLRGQKLDFEDFGTDAPDRLAADALLVGLLSDEDWRRLAVDPVAGTILTSGRLLAFVDDPALVPGVYAQPAPAGRSYLAKVTLPLPALLPSDPRARETLAALLRAALAPGQN